MADLVIVSGAPRSGTSMAMAMLEAGGLPVFVEPITRNPSRHNAGGFFEHGDVGKGSAWVPEAKGKAVKVLFRKLGNVPADVSADVIWMDRPEADVAASWHHMVTFRRQYHPNQQPPASGLEQRAEAFVWACKRPGFRVLNLAYNMVVDAPEAAARRIAKFLGLDLDVAAMARIPRAERRHYRDGARVA